MQWKVSATVGYIFYSVIYNKAVRLGVTSADILREAIKEYLERNPQENEREELKKYPKHGGSLYD